MKVAASARIKVADEVWIATSLLHREHPQGPDFSIEDIVNRASKECIAGVNRPGVYVHAVQHCVANRPPNSARYRMLFETGPGRRRLFRKGDPSHPDRERAKVMPNPQDIPAEYQPLLEWYRQWSDGTASSRQASDPLLALAGSGKDLWSQEHADEYVRRLREGWE